MPETWPPVCVVLTRDLDWTEDEDEDEDEELLACDLVGGRFAEADDAVLADCTVLS